MIDIDELLLKWENNYKKGLLTFWLLLILHEKEVYAFEMSSIVHELSCRTISADEKSIYRALNRFDEMGLVTSTWRNSDVGPRRRYYALTEEGLDLLREFTMRNILIFDEPEVARRIEALLASI